MHEILIGDVEIIRRLMPRSARVRNIVAATPGCERMPAPMIDTLARSWFSSTVTAPSVAWTSAIASRVAGTSSLGTENESSATPCTTFCMIVSTFTFLVAIVSNTAAAAPGRSGMPVNVNTTSFSLWVTPEMIASSIPSSPIQVPSSSENVERA